MSRSTLAVLCRYDKKIPGSLAATGDFALGMDGS